MLMVEFGIVHDGCVVNEMSRALPDIRLISAGGFTLSPTGVDEVLAIESADDGDIATVVEHFQHTPGITHVDVLERTPDKAFVRIRATVDPPGGYCSQTVERNRCFKLGKETQHGGVERWKVGCYDRAQAERLVEDLKKLGELKYHKISEVSWEALVREPGT